MKFKAVIFDLDGTILDTLGDLTASVNFALGKNNLPRRTQAEVRSFIGNGIRLLIERAVPSYTEICVVDKCFEDFKAHYKNNSAVHTKAYDGIKEQLLLLKQQGIKTAVVSNKADFAVQSLVKEYFNGLFDYSVGECEGARRKPFPDSVLRAMAALNVTADECIYIGDSDVDIETARNAHMKCVAVTWGFRDKSYLQSLSPDFIIDNPNEISNVLGDLQ